MHAENIHFCSVHTVAPGGQLLDSSQPTDLQTPACQARQSPFLMLLAYCVSRNITGDSDQIQIGPTKVHRLQWDFKQQQAAFANMKH